MKNQWLFLSILLVFVLACSLGPKSVPSPTPAPTNTLIPTKTAAPPPTPEPTLVPAPTSNPLLFMDSFEGALDPGWQWIKENKNKWNLTNNPGWLEILAGSGGVAAGNVDNLLLRQIPNGNFELETKLKFKPTANFQIAGLIIFESAANFIQFGRAFCQPSNVCKGDGLYFDNVVNGGFVDGNFSTPAPNIDTLYIRLRREGNTYTAYLSEDGSQWKLVGSHSNSMNAMFVGLVAGQSTLGSVPAQFDTFTITALP